MSTQMCMIVAASDNDVIGIDNSLPWHLPVDLKYFKRVTMGHPVVMGRKTFESIGKPLPGRVNYVISSTKVDCPGVITLSAPERLQSPTGKVFIIGGSQVYKAYESYIDTVYLTRVGLTLQGDAHLPFPIKAPVWQLAANDPFQTIDPFIHLEFQVWTRSQA